VANYLDKRGFVRPAFRRISGELEAATVKQDAQFAAPWRAVEAYLQHLANAGVARHVVNEYMLETTISNRWNEWFFAEAARVATFENAVKMVEWILGEVPDEERCGVTIDKWLLMIEPRSGEPHRRLLESSTDQNRISAELRAIHGVFTGNRTDIGDTLGLPIEKEVERRLAAIAAREAERKAAAATAAERAKQDRRDQLALEAEKLFSGPALGEWLNTPKADLDGRTPLEASERGVHGLAKAKQLLHQAERQRHTEEERAEEVQSYRNKLAREAQNCLGSAAQSFLRDRNEDLDNLPPAIYCKDARTYRAAMIVLGKWEQFLKIHNAPF
jgi:hypothetical protein